MKKNKYVNIAMSSVSYLLLLGLLTLIVPPVQAFFGAPYPAECAGATGWMTTTYYDGCNFISKDGSNLIKNATTFTSSQQPIFSGKAFVPYTDKWKLRAYMCPSTKPTVCTLAKATSYMDTINAVEVESSVSLGRKSDLFKSGEGIIPANTALCYTIFAANMPDIQWATNDKVTCPDAHMLPTTPSDCYINEASDLNISMGSLERSDIPTEPDPNNVMTKTSSVSVLCTRDATTAVVTRFNYTPVSVSSHNLVSTGIDGLGVAIYYKGTLIENGQSLPVENFETGFSYIELKFIPVRDRSTAVKNIATGDFSADAVLEMTEQ